MNLLTSPLPDSLPNRKILPRKSLTPSARQPRAGHREHAVCTCSLACTPVPGCRQLATLRRLRSQARLGLRSCGRPWRLPQHNRGRQRRSFYLPLSLHVFELPGIRGESVGTNAARAFDRRQRAAGTLCVSSAEAPGSVERSKRSGTSCRRKYRSTASGRFPKGLWGLSELLYSR
jgi:hypothetical protein